uniref:Uncharacterized protein n=1 Tax=Stomoxys calcitrans TaxID=35570 RepID=A0A1I8PKF0_STOCA
MIICALKYNLQKGIQNSKQQGHQLIVASYNNLMKNQEHKVENPKDAYIVGWCIELLHAAHIIYDDILDQSISRYGQPCWHQMENIGLTAFNDAIIFEKSLFLLMRLHLGTKDYYAKMMELFYEVALVTSCGQHMDLTYYLPNVYAAFEKKTLEAIRKRIQQASKEVPGEVMLQTLNKIYQQAQYI